MPGDVGDGGGASADLAAGSREQAAALVDAVKALQAAHEQELHDLRDSYEAKIKDLSEEIKVLKEGSTTMSAEDAMHSQDAMHCSLSRDSAFSDEKQSFIEFIIAATRNTTSAEYRQLYHFLLRCFTDADNNFDGRVGFHEFEMLIEASVCLPRRFGFAPSTGELYLTDWDRVKTRLALFKSLSSKKTKDLEGNTYEYITFDAWVNYAISHIREKAKAFEGLNTRSQMERSADEFKAFISSACRTRRSPEYKELYHFLLKVFADADSDCDGFINLDDFGKAVDAAVKAPRRFGFAPPESELYASEEEKKAARREIFTSLDQAGEGRLSFDVWLEYLYRHVCEKSATVFGHASSQMPAVPRAGPVNSNPTCPFESMVTRGR